MLLRSLGGHLSYDSITRNASQKQLMVDPCRRIPYPISQAFPSRVLDIRRLYAFMSSVLVFWIAGNLIREFEHAKDWKLRRGASYLALKPIHDLHQNQISA